MTRILAIDDEPDILALIRNALTENGYKVDTADRADTINLDRLIDYDLILLDIMMPGINGMAFCRKIRGMIDCPILFLTAKTRESDIVEGLGQGADDYITKPFGIGELQARVTAHLRRDQRGRHTVLNTSGIRFDLSAKEVSIREHLIPLTKSEYEICEFLAKNRGQVFSKEQIYDSVYGYAGESDSSTISEHVKNIRSKFSVYAASPILTVWGIGYKWA
jgi:DNA-binding response OmpR family regulator